MTLQEANDKFLGKECLVHWKPLDRAERKGETTPTPTKVVVTKIVEWFDANWQRKQNLTGLMFFSDRLLTPFEVDRLSLVE